MDEPISPEAPAIALAGGRSPYPPSPMPALRGSPFFAAAFLAGAFLANGLIRLIRPRTPGIPAASSCNEPIALTIPDLDQKHHAIGRIQGELLDRP